MSTILNFSNFSFSAEQIRDINELVFDEILKAPELAEIHTLYSGIIYDKEIGFITEGGLVGKASQGCSPDAQDYTIGTRKVLWQPKSWEIYLSECYKDLESTAAVYALNQHTRISDLTDTDYMAIVVKVLTESVKKMLYRFVWFNDTDADNVEVTYLPKAEETEQTVGSAIVGTVYAGVTSSTAGAVQCALEDGTIVYLAGTAAVGTAADDTIYYSKDTVNTVAVLSGGNITSGVDTDYFNLLDGLFKQLETAVAGGAASVTIAANNKATKAEQDSALTGDAAYAILKDMYYKAPVQMRGAGMRFLVTQSVADAYEEYLNGKGIESTYRNLTEGIKELKFKGIEVYALPIWDEMIRSYQDLGTKFYKPHRAVLVEKANLAVGTPSEEAFGEMDIWYSKETKKTNIRLEDKIDAKLLNTERLVFAQ